MWLIYQLLMIYVLKGFAKYVCKRGMFFEDDPEQLEVRICFKAYHLFT